MKYWVFQSKTAAGVIIALAVFLLVSCNSKPVKQTDTFTSGRIKIGIDDSYRLMMEAQLDVFTSIYRDASFDTIYSDEIDIKNLFLKDSIPAMIVSSPLTKEETDALLSQRYVARSTIIGQDAIALILNKDNKTNNFLYDQVQDIFTGKISKWSQIDPTNHLGKLSVVFDKPGSSNIRYFMHKFKITKYPSYFGATRSNHEIIHYVETHKNAIGILSVNWISDPQDSVSHNFLKRIQVAGITSYPGSTSANTYYQPYQAYIVYKYYPFIRNIYFINRQTYDGLASGLDAFLAGEKGQRIILRSGLVPAAAPVTIVQINH
ncbi:PstS family phosphate ABC transporter substrate-binding protein [Microbacter margulisiae]|uniref:Phosphate transport system substrate-binding protein n=1 Tax=Microbacter margulisiae TaxID=1350067 RepID=A0A7W5DN32_9PORP|nr:substrate-binding domain-containing protein [Microbacter margulisiae]MBB3185891.1 phosphate transport system substrate-binding protein [Microbacter margulisiae]